jgi:hypothetical protein
MKTDINKFYNRASWKQPHTLCGKITGYYDHFDIDLVGHDQKPDCHIGHFGYNFYMRTPKGMNRLKYKSLQSMFRALKTVTKNNGYNLESIGIKHGYKYKTLWTA